MPTSRPPPSSRCTALTAAQRPRTEREKHDQFLIRFSGAVGKDLSGFLAAWGVDLSEGAKRETSNLPLWLPDGFSAAPR